MMRSKIMFNLRRKITTQNVYLPNESSIFIIEFIENSPTEF